MEILDLYKVKLPCFILLSTENYQMKSNIYAVIANRSYSYMIWLNASTDESSIYHFASRGRDPRTILQVRFHFK